MKSKVVAGLATVAVGSVVVDAVSRLLIRRHENHIVEPDDLPGQLFWVRGVGLHYVEQGEGYPVVLIHGFMGSTFSFRHTIPALARHFRVLAVDLPGFGFADRSDHVEYSHTNWVTLLSEFLRRQGISRAFFVGHSMGGGVIQRLAVMAPHMVAGLVLVASTSAADPPWLPRGPGAGPMLRLIQATVLSQPRVLRYFAGSAPYDPAFMTAAVLEGYATPLRVPGTSAAIRKLMRDARRDQPVQLGANQPPALLIWGERDRVVDRTVGDGLLRAMPGARLEIVERAGHLPLEEQPDACNGLMLAFFRELQHREFSRAAIESVPQAASAGRP